MKHPKQKTTGQAGGSRKPMVIAGESSSEAVGRPKQSLRIEKKKRIAAFRSEPAFTASLSMTYA